MSDNLPLYRQVLTAVRERLTPPENYFKGWYAGDKDGNPVHHDLTEGLWYDNPKVCKFCYRGALHIEGRKVGLDVFGNRFFDRWEAAMLQIKYGHNSSPNISDTSHEACLEMIDYLISQCGDTP